MRMTSDWIMSLNSRVIAQRACTSREEAIEVAQDARKKLPKDFTWCILDEETELAMLVPEEGENKCRKK